ncbi:unnamed protein product [Amoebophrya sp. A25]|nr:unnamed protein product [Amoebophrya sp. A25]|eukprot:GSA25T00015922001.1
MLLDVIGLCESAQGRRVWEGYCSAFGSKMERKKPFVYKFGKLGLLGREKLSGPLVFRVDSDVLEKAGLASRCKPEKEIKAKIFAKKDIPVFDKGLDEPELILSLLDEVIDRIVEVLRSHHSLAIAFPGLGRLTFPSDRNSYSWMERRWEPLEYVTGRDALDPEDYVPGAETEAKNAPGFSVTGSPGHEFTEGAGRKPDETVSELSSVDGDRYMAGIDIDADPSWRPLTPEGGWPVREEPPVEETSLVADGAEEGEEKNGEAGGGDGAPAGG